MRKFDEENTIQYITIYCCIKTNNTQFGLKKTSIYFVLIICYFEIIFKVNITIIYPKQYKQIFKMP